MLEKPFCFALPTADEEFRETAAVEPHQAETMGRAELERHLAGCEPPSVGRIEPANDGALQIVTVSLRCSGGARGAAQALSLEFVTSSRRVEMVLLASRSRGTAR